MRALVVAILICAIAPAALAQSYSISGQAGYLQEWEMKASLAKTVTEGTEDFSGAVTLRHVGLCSINGVEEKSGTLQLSVSRAGVEGTLALPDDSCRISAAASPSHSGLMNCRNGEGVPIHFTIEQAGAAGQGTLAAEK